jgi:hypothetical protein
MKKKPHVDPTSFKLPSGRVAHFTTEVGDTRIWLATSIKQVPTYDIYGKGIGTTMMRIIKNPQYHHHTADTGELEITQPSAVERLQVGGAHAKLKF